MENIYEPPKAKLDKYSVIPRYKLFHISGIGIATFLGSVLAGGVLMAINFKRLGNINAFKIAIIYSLIGFFAKGLIIYVLPDNILVNLGITVVEIILMVEIAKRQFEKPIAKHIQQKGEMASNWLAVGVSMVVWFFIMITFIAYLIIAF